MDNIVVFCAVLVTAVAAYNFEDPEYNRFLAGNIDDLSENYHSFAHPRTRRDEEAAIEDEKCSHMRSKKLCCAEEITKTLSMGHKELTRECFKEVKEKEKHHMYDPFSCESMKQHKKIIICSMECVGKKTDMLDSEGNLKPEKFESFIKENFVSETWMEPMLDKIISTCLDEAKKATANRDESDSSSCNPAATEAGHCLFRETQMNCPADQIKDQKSCARLRERLTARLFSPLSGGSMEDN